MAKTVFKHSNDCPKPASAQQVDVIAQQVDVITKLLETSAQQVEALTELLENHIAGKLNDQDGHSKHTPANYVLKINSLELTNFHFRSKKLL